MDATFLLYHTTHDRKYQILNNIFLNTIDRKNAKKLLTEVTY